MRHSIEVMSRPIGRSSSVRNPSTQRNLSASTIMHETEQFDTALPPMSLVSTRRPHNGQQRLPYPQNLTSIHGGANAHRRTGSTLKTVMKKIFTRNRRSQTDGTDDPMSEYHTRNNSTAAPNKPQKSPSPSKPRSSHQSGRNQPTAETLATLDIVLKQLDTEPRQRRATLPSLILSDDGSRHALETVLNAGKKPSNRKLSPHANSDPDEVRRRKMRSTKRRSRSAGALRVLANEHRMSPIQWKRRRSVESDHVTSTAYDATSESDFSRPPTRSTVASAPKPSEEVSVFEADEPDEPGAPPSLTPSLPPNVGELISSMQTDDNASLGQRMTTLEVKLIDLEFAIARLQSGRTEPPVTDSPNQKPPQHNRKKSKSSSHSHTSSRDISPTEDPIPETDRPLSTATIRPSLADIHRARALQAPSVVSLSSESSTISVQQYSALVMLLRREQTARRNLEQQVSGLREDIERLTNMAQESISVGTMYPIRSFESQEYLRLRPDESPSTSPRQTLGQADDKATRYKSDSDSDRDREQERERQRTREREREKERERERERERSASDLRSKDERFRPWQATRRVEVANMI
ncbi:hypothetical protein BDV18DRAFT_124735 [Aspergillus unguis]